MGAKPTSIAELPENEALCHLVGSTKISREDEFWDNLLAFSFSSPLTKLDNRLLKDAVAGLCEKLAVNNKNTGNFTTLIHIFVYNARDLHGDTDKINDVSQCQKCHNALLLSRVFIEYIVESLQEDYVIQQFNTLPAFEGTPTVLDDFLFCLSDAIGNLPVLKSTYGIHLEAVNSLLILLSVQMYESRPVSDSLLYLAIMNGKCCANAVQLVRKLFHNYIKNEPVPPPDVSQGIMGWAASSLWSLVGGKSHEAHHSVTNSLNPLANHSGLLLLVLSFHYTKASNPYRQALVLCTAGIKSEGESPERTSSEVSFPLNFKRLFNAIGRDLHKDETVLLLYLLLLKNESFLNYVLLRSDIEVIVLPVLQVLYNASERDTHHIYMALIVILILTQEDVFNKSIHQSTVSNVDWYKDKNLTGISLGSLLVLIILRTIQFNMAKMRDKYLHTNCLASLANMSGSFRHLHPVATQKFISLFHQLMRKHGRFCERVRLGQVNAEDELTDLAVLEEIIRMMLEVLNSCLCSALQENANLVFALLRSKELFQEFKTNPKFQDVVRNIDSVLSYFGARVEESANASSSADEVMLVISEAVSKWPKEQLVKVPDLKFKYMEEEAAEEFFVPYVWSVVYKSCYLYWNTDKVALFHVSPARNSEST